MLEDRLSNIRELDRYECFAADGHWHKGAVHDRRHKGKKMAVGHLNSLNLRTHTLRHLAVGQGLHEHDMSALKRVKLKGLRQGLRQGRQVLIVYDKAGIDFGSGKDSALPPRLRLSMPHWLWVILGSLEKDV